MTQQKGSASGLVVLTTQFDHLQRDRGQKL